MKRTLQTGKGSVKKSRLLVSDPPPAKRHDQDLQGADLGAARPVNLVKPEPPLRISAHTLHRQLFAANQELFTGPLY
jgi:hypothetical protein